MIEQIRWLLAEWLVGFAISVAPDYGLCRKGKQELATFILDWLPKQRARANGANV